MTGRRRTVSRELESPMPGLRAHLSSITIMKNSIFALASFLAGAASISFLAGCESQPERHGRPDGGGAAGPALRPIAMAGEAVFFDGQVAVQVLLTRGIDPGPGERSGGAGSPGPDRAAGRRTWWWRPWRRDGRRAR